MSLSLLIAALAFTAGADPAGTLASAVDDLAARACAGSDPGTVALTVFAPAAMGLREPIETALSAAVARRGFTPVPLRAADAADAEGAARALPADLLLRVRAALSAEGLSLIAEVVRTRPNFFLQRIPEASAGSARLSAVTIPASASLRSLAATRMAGSISLVPLATLDEHVLALGAGSAEGGAARIAVVTPTRVLLLDASGKVLSTFALGPAPPGRGVRDPAATVAVGDFGAGQVAFALAGRPGGEVLSMSGDRLAPAGSLPAAPLAASAAGRLFGTFVPGRGVLADAVGRTADALGAASPGLTPLVPQRGAPQPAHALVAVAGSPHPDRVAYGLLTDDDTLHLLGPDLAPAAPDVSGVGAGFALADVDGDGEPEVVASSAVPGSSDRVRVLRPGAAAETAFTSAPVDGSFLAGAAADITGDGVDDAVLAADLPDGRAQLWLLTRDARGGSR